jgi:hypothetical protein
MKRILLVVVALLAASACSNPAGPGTDGTLEANRKKFESAVGSNYTVEYGLTCFCTTDATAPVRLTVRNGAIVSVVRLSDGASVPPATWPITYRTVAQIFDELEDALEKKRKKEFATVNVTYDASLGYPRDVWLDQSEGLADEERGYALRNAARTP